jgi:uncharacterized membrane protein
MTTVGARSRVQFRDAVIAIAATLLVIAPRT